VETAERNSSLEGSTLGAWGTAFGLVANPRVDVKVQSAATRPVTRLQLSADNLRAMWVAYCSHKGEPH
jgi:hypothetical protein